MPSINPGDTVRYLNEVGGGRVTRIEGQTAYIDDHGFETPMLLRECVVVARAGEKPSTTHFRAVAEPPKPEAAAAPAPAPRMPEPEPEEEEEEEEEVEGNDKLDLVLAFEPLNPKTLSTTTYEATLVNDSNYYLSYSVATRKADDKEWTLMKAGTAEPNMQHVLAELGREEIGRMERVLVQWTAWKKSRPYEAKAPGWVERRIDTVKFFKLHCFKPSAYFDTPVIELTLVEGDVAVTDRPEASPKAMLEEAARQAARRDKRPVTRRSKPAQATVHARRGDIIEVDLHCHELLDNTRGLSNADILNRQIDEFERVMDENLKNHGQKIVFIHGKGEGVLRQALMKELSHRYRGKAEAQDASFAQYGFGATQVTIH